jgi:hypothetical protein
MEYQHFSGLDHHINKALQKSKQSQRALEKNKASGKATRASNPFSWPREYVLYSEPPPPPDEQNECFNL